MAALGTVGVILQRDIDGKKVWILASFSKSFSSLVFLSLLLHTQTQTRMHIYIQTRTLTHTHARTHIHTYIYSNNDKKINEKKEFQNEANIHTL